MTYTPRNIQQKTSSKGTNYIVADFEDMNGQVFENVSTFDAVKEGVSLDGQIIQNGNYLNFKAQPKIATGGKTAQMEKVMDKKADNISHAQDRKEQAIAHAGSVTNATNLVIAILESNIWANKSEQMVKDKIREYIAWYHTIYENPNEIPSNPDNVPF